jgi:hypothetical protein
MGAVLEVLAQSLNSLKDIKIFFSFFILSTTKNNERFSIPGTQSFQIKNKNES